MVNGTDLAEVNQEAWLRHVTWMPQNPYILQDSVRENILLTDPAGVQGGRTLGRAELDELAAMTGLDQDLAAMAGGWETGIGEGGAGLSGGQRQRLALTRFLARTVSQKTPLLLLDEPTAHLDKAGGEVVLAALRKLSGHHTVIIASHDPQVRIVADIVTELAPKGEG